VVSKEEISGGGEAAPGSADRAAPENILGRKANKYLPHQDLLRKGKSEGGDAAAARPRRHYSYRGFCSDLLSLDHIAVVDDFPLLAGGCRVFD
jgi:hypothetical protein